MDGKNNDADGGVQGDFGDEGPTKIIVAREFLCQQLDRRAEAHERLAARDRSARARIAAGEGIEALSELRQETVDMLEVEAGTVRAIDNTLIAEFTPAQISLVTTPMPPGRTGK